VSENLFVGPTTMITTDLRGRYGLPSRSFLLCGENQGFVDGYSDRIAGWHENVLLGALFVVMISTVLLGFIVVQWQEWIQFRDQGVPTGGVIVGHRIVDGKSDTYYLTYRYSARDGAGITGSYTHEERVFPKLYNDLTVGTFISVRYLVRRPTIATIAWTPALPVSYPFGSAGSGLVSLVGVAVLVLKARHLHCLRNEGRLLVGTLLSCTSSKDSKGNLTIVMRYRFQTLTGHTFDRSASRQRNDLKGAVLPQAGTPIVVVYVSDVLYQVL
jgi:hypothetical protein